MERNKQVIVAYKGPDANRTYSRGRAKWRDALARAKAITTTVAPCCLRLENVLSRTPSLPERIIASTHPNSGKFLLKGFSTWAGHVDNNCPWRRKCEPDQAFPLDGRHPVICKISPNKSFVRWDADGTTSHNAIALLVLGWAYVLAADLLERRGLKMEFCRLDDARNDCDVESRLVRLGYATARERAWWNALLGNPSSYSFKGGRVHPWSVTTCNNFGLVFEENHTLEVHSENAPPPTPPSAREAAVSISRLCHALGLGSSQCTAALAVALTLPFRASSRWSTSATMELPALDLPDIVDRAVGINAVQQPPPEFFSLGRFMALSLNSFIFGATLWSVFWEPNVPCNYSAAWTRAVYLTLEPILAEETGDMELFAKVMACAASSDSDARNSPLWLGMALGGSEAIASTILTYLLHVYPYKPAHPSMTAAAWTGIPNSFMDLQPPGPHVRPNSGCVSRAQVWRLRHDFHEFYESGHGNFASMPPLTYPPFGMMRQEDVELEIREHLACNHRWTYKGWTWLPGTDLDRGPPVLDKENAPKKTSVPRQRMRAVRIPNKHLKGVQKASERVTHEIFWWSNTQVERGFGGTIVAPIPTGRGPEDAGGSPTRPDSFNVERILAWRDDFVKKTEQSRQN